MGSNDFTGKDKCPFCGSSKNINVILCEDCSEMIVHPQNSYITYMEYINPVLVCLKYNEYIKKIIWEFKFSQKTYLYKTLGQLMAESLLKDKSYRQFSIITSVPMDRRSYRKRGYNQSELLAKYIAESLFLDYSDLLEKPEKGKMQIELDYFQRRANLEGAFKCCDLKAVENKNIIIVDDIFTTGSTLNTCAKELLDKGASRVMGLCLASGSVE